MSKRKLLLADDSITIQKVVNLTFADEGIEVIAVGDGDAAMQKFVESTPDLVMADVNMPGIDGYRICEMIKQDDETMNIPVILLVGSFEPFDEEEARRVGADDYLTKPFQSIRQLVNKVTDLLKSSNGDDPSSFEETAQFEPAAQLEPADVSKPVYMETAAAQLGDAGMDDEMIQTNQIGSLPVGEPQKFESEFAGQSFEHVSPTMLGNSYQSPIEDSTAYQSEDDLAKTQPLTTQEFKDITAAPSAVEETALPEEEKIAELADVQYFEQTETIEPEISESHAVFEPEEIAEQSYSEPQPADETGQATVDESQPELTAEREFTPDEKMPETVPMPEVASILDLDEMNLLELPPREKKDSFYFQAKPVEPEQSEIIVQTPSDKPAQKIQTESGATEEEIKNMSDSTVLTNLSPESIEALADRVADLIIKKLAQQEPEDIN